MIDDVGYSVRSVMAMVKRIIDVFQQDCSKPTLAHMAKELRLTRLVEILQGSLEAEHHLSVWFQGLKSPLEPDIETELERALQAIEQVCGRTLSCDHSDHHGEVNGPLIRYVKLRVARVPGIPGTFSPPPTSKENTG